MTAQYHWTGHIALLIYREVSREMELYLEGKVAITTGAGRGIGRQIAKTLAEEGAKVVVNDLYEERASAVAEEIKKAGGEAFAVGADVTKWDEVNDAVNRILQKWGKTDILVNNAGVPAGISAIALVTPFVLRTVTL